MRPPAAPTIKVTSIMTTRRDFFKNLGMAGGAVAAASVSSVALAALPELVSMDNPDTASPLSTP